MKNHDEITQRTSEMTALIQAWADINTHTANVQGIQTLLKDVERAFANLQPDHTEIFPFGLYLTKRNGAPLQLFLGGHIDTVYPVDHPFQKSTLNGNTLNGPGVTDMKGGLVIMLKALEAFEKSECKEKMGWRVFINTDEETGSLQSTLFLEKCARNVDAALLFEPAYADNALVSTRKGSANYKVISHGKTAHAGRDAHLGVNAIYPLSRFIAEAASLSHKGVLINVGIIKGGEAYNIIPDYAECGVNVRCDALNDQKEIDEKLKALAKQHQLEMIQLNFRPPKPLDAKTIALFETLKRCGEKLGIKVFWKPSGGVCDGNTFAALGVPTIDTLGVRGGNIHTKDEYCDVTSLVEKVDLTTLLLQEIALKGIPE